MGWEHKIADAMKRSGIDAKEKAIKDASAYIGTIEQVSPLIVSLMGGEAMFEAEKKEIVQSRTFSEYGTTIKKKNEKVIVLPVDSLDKIAVIDIVKGG